MKCKEIQYRIPEYLEGQLSENEKKAFIRHLEQCNDCKELLAQVSHSMQYLGKKESIPYQPFYYTRLKAKMEKRQEAVSAAPAPIWKRVLQPAAYTFFLGVGIYIGILLGSGLNSNQQEISQAEKEKSELDAYAESAFMNEMELESLTSTFILTNDTSYEE